MRTARSLMQRLGAGESEAIALAIELGATWLLVDDRAARRAATAQGVPTVGALAILTAARRRGLLTNLREAFDALLAAHFRASPDLMNAMLLEVGEPAAY